MRTLLSIEKVYSIRNLVALRAIYDKIEIQVRSLENLGVDSRQYGPLLIPVLMQKIPEDLALLISREFVNVDDCWSMKTVLNILKKEIQAREGSQLSKDEVQHFTAETLYSSGNMKPQNKFKNFNDYLKCIFCDKNHKSQECMTIISLEDKRRILKNKRRCFKCLKIRHLSKDCNTKMKCFYCSNFYHAAMCINKIANKKIDIQENCSSSLASLSKCNNSVLLQTARVNVTANNINQPARILFDSCSQLSYISPSLRSKLNLKTLDSKRIVINTFGNQSETEVLERVQFTVKDLVPDCYAASAIRGIIRFFARRGVPSEIVSDNGTQFTSKETQAFVASMAIKWRFNVAAAPWWGGIFERLVRSTKRCLKKILSNSKITYEELLTVLLKVECVINNRPLTFSYEEPGDEVVTPNHLVFWRMLNLEVIPESSSNDYNIDTNQRNKHLYMLLTHFQSRWKDEYLKNLREDHKSSKVKGSAIIKEGDVVLIDDSLKSRILLKVGIVEDIKYSKNNEIRSAIVIYIHNNTCQRVNRTVNKLYPLNMVKNK
ncbi:uncharacterized protein LOC105845216 [Hydra vulgaris]|uniref:uncharacterized protein LOC105845216 n=1 Tax=Hydra vulgaris TaxID=6087 RepID=UPI001F5EE1AF|nr:uncharacterized protein LOC105845216 [Hydra vulgaris]